MLTVGIDIGTSFSSIAFLNEKTGEAEAIKVQSGYGDKNSMPSAVFVEENGNVLLGQAALNAKMRDPASFKAEFKRDLGQEVPYMLGNCQLLPEELYKEVFICFKKCAEESTGEKIGKAYITYPANYNKRKKELIESAAKKAGLLDVEMIDEPSAAAFCYFSKGKITEGDRLLIYDFGGGTFDTALLQYSDGVFKPLTEAMGLERCGGIDIDNLIFEDILSRVPEEQLQGISANAAYKKRFHAQVMDASIRIKHQLSDSDRVQDVIPVGFDTCDYSLNRNRFNGMIHSLVEETMDRVRSIIGQAGIKAGDIAHVVVVGGSSRIPYVRDRLKLLTGKEISMDIDADLAICRGAALIQAEKEKQNPGEQYKQGMAHYDNEDYEQAFECLSKAAEGGHAEAQYYLGKLYDDGDGVERDNVQAAAWYNKSAEQGNADAQNCMASAYKFGKGVEKDYRQAYYWCQKAAEQGQADAQTMLGVLYAWGEGVEQDYKQAAHWYRKSAEQGISGAQYALGELYDKGRGIPQDYKQAAYWYQKSAEQGHANAQNNLAILYLNGWGVARDNDEAAYWYQKAAEQDIAEAQCTLSDMYNEGVGVPQDDDMALYWAQRGADKGDASVQCQLACLYDDREDYDQAIFWFRKAAEQGDTIAERQFGFYYENSLGVAEDIQQALYWYKKAAEKGDAAAQMGLGLLYEMGPAKYRDIKLATYWYEKAAKQGDDISQFCLGRLYEGGNGVVAQDMKQAAYWYQQAAEQDYAEAQFAMGWLYYGDTYGYKLYKSAFTGKQMSFPQGLGVNRDYNMAGILWAKAAAQGHKEAMKTLKLVRKDSSGRYVKA